MRHFKVAPGNDLNLPYDTAFKAIMDLIQYSGHSILTVNRNYEENEIEIDLVQ